MLHVLVQEQGTLPSCNFHEENHQLHQSGAMAPHAPCLQFRGMSYLLMIWHWSFYSLAPSLQNMFQTKNTSINGSMLLLLFRNSMSRNSIQFKSPWYRYFHSETSAMCSNIMEHRETPSSKLLWVPWVVPPCRISIKWGLWDSAYQTLSQSQHILRHIRWLIIVLSSYISIIYIESPWFPTR